jgi:hypothetical protein
MRCFAFSDMPCGNETGYNGTNHISLDKKEKQERKKDFSVSLESSICYNIATMHEKAVGTYTAQNASFDAIVCVIRLDAAGKRRLA